jgi:hypothetical protein
MGWLDRLKGRSAQPERGTKAFGIPTVKGPPGRPRLTPPGAPRKRGKSAEQYDAELAAYRRAMRKHFAEIAAFNRRRCVALGIASYEWVAMDVHEACDVAKRNGGQVFRYDEPPPDGHVCEGQCNSPDWCRCIARPNIAGFS